MLWRLKMSQTGEIVLYRGSQYSDPGLILNRILEKISPIDIHNSIGCMKTMDESGNYLDTDNGDIERLPVPADLTEISKYIRNDNLLMISIIECRYFDYMLNLVEDKIPEDIREDFSITDMSILVGYHDLTSCDEDAEVHVCGHAFFSIAFSGYSIANDFDGFKNALMSLKEFQNMKEEFEEIMGELDVLVNWFF